MTTAPLAQVADLLGKAATAELVKALRALEAQPPSRERNLVRCWTIEELERRFPEASHAVEAAYVAAEEDGQDLDYAAVLLAAIPA